MEVIIATNHHNTKRVVKERWFPSKTAMIAVTCKNVVNLPSLLGLQSIFRFNIIKAAMRPSERKTSLLIITVDTQ